MLTGNMTAKPDLGIANLGQQLQAHSRTEGDQLQWLKFTCSVPELMKAGYGWLHTTDNAWDRHA